KDLLVAVEGLHQGRPFFSARVADYVLQHYHRRGGGGAPEPPPSPSSTLTTREREVLQLLVEGQSNKEVAASLGIGVKTAEAEHAQLRIRFVSRDHKHVFAARDPAGPRRGFIEKPFSLDGLSTALAGLLGRSAAGSSSSSSSH